MPNERYSWGYWGRLISDHTKAGKDRTGSRIRKNAKRKARATVPAKSGQPMEEVQP